jgi:hypothetical protein
MMATTIVLAVFIASATTFEAGVAEDSAFRHASFPNSTRGIEQLGKWLDKAGVTEFDRVCVSGPPIAATPASRFWSTRKVRVDSLPYDRIKAYMGEHKIAHPSAEVVARACLAVPPKGSAAVRRK